MTKTIPDWMYGNIPEHMRSGVMLYIQRGAEPGGFLRSVLENDFHGALARADLVNLGRIKAYKEMLDMIPNQCWGSRKKVATWIAMGGWEGKSNEDT